MSKQWFECENGHKIVLEGDVEMWKKKAAKRDRHGVPGIVCPHCKPENVALTPCDPPDAGYMQDLIKQFRCKHGHVTRVSAWDNGICNVSWNHIDDAKTDDTFENYEADPALMLEMIESGAVRCEHMTVDKRGRKRRCNCKLVPLDDSPLVTPAEHGTHGFKTALRVGDIWDRNKCPEPKSSRTEVVGTGINADAVQVDTEFSRRNRHRLSQDSMYVYDDSEKKQVKIRRKRISEQKGETIKRPTKRSYKNSRDSRSKPS